MRQDFTEDYMDGGILPNFKRVKENGLFAKDIRTIFPSLTAASHAAISTGAKPGKTGMVSNNLHKENIELNDQQSAFFSPLDVTPIWAEAREQGKTTATVLFPGSNPEEGNQATYSIYFGTTWNDSALEELTFKKADKWLDLPKSYSPVKEATLSLKLENSINQKIYILAADSTNNGVTDYDTFYFYTEKNSSVPEVVHFNEWGSISFPVQSSHLAGFSFKLKNIDASLEDVEIYRTAVTSAVLYGPQEFKDNIQSKYGHLPVQDDDKALEMNWITRSEYEEISEQFAKWTTDVSLHIKEEYKPDLLFFYYPQIDHEEHKYLLVDPRQPGYSKRKSRRYMNYVKWSYQLSDKALGDTLDKMNENDRLFLVSDHGMEPVHTMISPNHELERSGLLIRDEDGKVDLTKSKAYAVASGSISHIYINLENREHKGIVSKEEYPQIQKEILDTFNGLKAKEVSNVKKMWHLFNNWREISYSDNAIHTSKVILDDLIDENGKPFEDILGKGIDEAEIFSHKQAGDILLVANQGYYISQDETLTFKKAVDLGNHGGNPERMELRPVLFVAGGNYSTSNITEKVSTLDIAPTLYEMLNLNAPDFIDGQVINEIIEAESN